MQFVMLPDVSQCPPTTNPRTGEPFQLKMPAIPMVMYTRESEIRDFPTDLSHLEDALTGGDGEQGNLRGEDPQRREGRGERFRSQLHRSWVLVHCDPTSTGDRLESTPSPTLFPRRRV